MRGFLKGPEPVRKVDDDRIEKFKYLYQNCQ